MEKGELTGLGSGSVLYGSVWTCCKACARHVMPMLLHRTKRTQLCKADDTTENWQLVTFPCTVAGIAAHYTCVLEAMFAGNQVC